MRTYWRIFAGLGLALWVLTWPLSSSSHPLHDEAETRAVDWHQTTLADFAEGTFDNLQLLDFGNGALSLSIEEDIYPPRGVYTSAVKLADFDFNAVGLQWRAHLPPDTGLQVSIRASTDGIAWLPWQEVVEPEREGNHFYAFTPLIVDRGQNIQYRLTLTTQHPNLTPRLEDITLTYIDSTPGPTLKDVESLPTPPQLQGGTVPHPTIITRSDWGANESYRFDTEGNEIWPTEYQPPRKIVIHHSVTANNDPNPPATVRAIYYYHAVTLGWGDVGYNYLADWHGNIYEGRCGGPDVVAGHTYSYNYGSVGICGVGTYGNTGDSVPPSAELLAGLADLSAWECSRSFINPNEASFFIDEVTENVAGHRDYNATACPGDYLYAELSSTRSEIWTKLLDYTPSYFAEYLAHDTPQTMVRGQTYTVSLSLRNAGTLTWLAEGQNPVRLRYRWYDDQGEVTPGEGQTPLPHDTSYGHIVELNNAYVKPPDQYGQYVLEWDLLHEDVTWFSLQGSPALTVPVTVFDPHLPPQTYVPLVLNE
jgi:hypothetical protein